MKIGGAFHTDKKIWGPKIHMKNQSAIVAGTPEAQSSQITDRNTTVGTTGGSSSMIKGGCYLNSYQRKGNNNNRVALTD